MASPFWTYFHDKLNWLPIFRPGPVSAVMKGLALHMDDVRADILWLRKQWNPATCEAELVEKFGASRGILRNRFDTDESYRRRVVQAYAWHKLGGKTRGLERILRESGFDAAIFPASDDALWAHFRVLLELGHNIFGPEDAALFWWLANEFKPARSIIEVLTTRSEISSMVWYGLGASHYIKTQAFTWRWPLELESLAVRIATGLSGFSCASFSFKNRLQENPRFASRLAMTAYDVSCSRILPRFAGKPEPLPARPALSAYSVSKSLVYPRFLRAPRLHALVRSSMSAYTITRSVVNVPDIPD